MEDMAKTTKWQFFVPGPLPAQNQLNNMQRGPKARRYNKAKTDWAFLVAHAARSAGVPPMAGRVTFSFEWQELNRRRDPDNISGAGRKFILDGLVGAGILKTDGWAGVAGFGGETFVVDAKRPGVFVTIELAE